MVRFQAKSMVIQPVLAGVAVCSVICPPQMTGDYNDHKGRSVPAVIVYPSETTGGYNKLVRYFVHQPEMTVAIKSEILNHW